MVPELRRHRPVNLADGVVEDDLVELGNHLSSFELAEVAPGLSGRTRGVLGRKPCEVGAVLDLSDQLLALLFAVDQDVSCRRSCHDLLRLVREFGTAPGSNAVAR